MVDTLGQQFTVQIPALRRYAKALLGNSSEVEDLVQETLTRALTKRHVWDRVRDVRAYLFTTLHNLYADWVGKQARQGPLTPIENVEWQLHQHAEQPGSLALRDLERGVRQLPTEQRQVVLLVGLEGMRYKEVAELLEIPIGTVMSRLSRGRETLRRVMEGEERPNVRRVK